MRTGYDMLLLTVAAVVVVGVAASAAYVLPKYAAMTARPSDLVVGAPAASSSSTSGSTAETKKMITSKIAESKSGKVEKATFGAGCFWGVEARFRETPGVLSTQVGYSGGSVLNPTYELVCTDTTGHAEVVHVEFDPEQVSYQQLLDIFWNNHNPTQLNFQGPDYGKQYRSVVFTHGEAQRAAAEASKQRLAESGKWQKPVVTQIVPFTAFFPAEDYHQQYLEKRGMSRCHL